MKLFLPLIFILIVFSNGDRLQAQENQTHQFSRFSLKNAMGNHAVGFPYENAFLAFTPHVSIGLEMGLNAAKRHGLFIASNLGFIKNEVIGNTIYTDFDLGYRYTSKPAIFMEISLGLGVLDQFHPEDIFQRNTSDGSYEQVNDTGRFSSLVALKTGIGYDISMISNLPITIALTHNFFIQTSYFDVKAFPIMPQSTTNILLTYKFKRS